MAVLELMLAGAVVLGGLLWKGKANAASSVSDSVQKRVADAIATGDHEVLERVAAELLAEGKTDAAVSLSSLAKQWRDAEAAQAAGVAEARANGVPLDGAPPKLKPVVIPAKVFADAAKELEETAAPDASDTVRAKGAALLFELGRVATGESRPVVASFQSAANAAGWKPALKVDGLYGEGTRDALRYYMGKDVPPPRYGKAKGKPYVAASMSEGGGTDDRGYMAQGVAGAVAGKSRGNYPEGTRNLVRQFQAAVGLDADGLYGSGTRAALIAYGVSNPPAAIY